MDKNLADYTHFQSQEAIKKQKSVQDISNNKQIPQRTI